LGIDAVVDARIKAEGTAQASRGAAGAVPCSFDRIMRSGALSGTAGTRDTWQNPVCRGEDAFCY